MIPSEQRYPFMSKNTKIFLSWLIAHQGDISNHPAVIKTKKSDVKTLLSLHLRAIESLQWKLWFGFAARDVTDPDFACNYWLIVVSPSLFLLLSFFCNLQLSSCRRSRGPVARLRGSCRDTRRMIEVRSMPEPCSPQPPKETLNLMMGSFLE